MSDEERKIIYEICLAMMNCRDHRIHMGMKNAPQVTLDGEQMIRVWDIPNLLFRIVGLEQMTISEQEQRFSTKYHSSTDD